MRFKIRFADQIVGTFLLTALAVVAVVVFFVVKGQNLFVERYPFWTLFDDAAGIAPGTPVKIRGIEVGKVKQVSLTLDNQVRVDFEVLAQYASRVKLDPPDADCSVDGLNPIELLDEPPTEEEIAARKATEAHRKKVCGSRVAMNVPAGLGSFLPAGLELTVGGTDAPVAPPGSRLASEKPEGLSEIIARLQKDGVVQNIKDIIAQTDALLRRINDAKGPIWSAIQNLQVVTARVRSGRGLVGQVLAPRSKYNKDLDEKLAQIDQILLNIEQTTDNALLVSNDAKDVSGGLEGRLDELMKVVDGLKKFSSDLDVIGKDLKTFASDAKDFSEDASCAERVVCRPPRREWPRHRESVPRACILQRTHRYRRRPTRSCARSRVGKRHRSPAPSSRPGRERPPRSPACPRAGTGARRRLGQGTRDCRWWCRALGSPARNRPRPGSR